MVPGLKFNHPKENGSSFPDSAFCQQLLNDGFSTAVVMRKKEGRKRRGRRRDTIGVILLETPHKQ